MGYGCSSSSLHYLLWYPSQSRWPSYSNVHHGYLAILCQLACQFSPGFRKHCSSTAPMIRHLLASLATIPILTDQNVTVLVCCKEYFGAPLLGGYVHLVCHCCGRFPGRRKFIALVSCQGMLTPGFRSGECQACLLTVRVSAICSEFASMLQSPETQPLLSTSWAYLVTPRVTKPRGLRNCSHFQFSLP
jgi:hypothetical protein